MFNFLRVCVCVCVKCLPSLILCVCACVVIFIDPSHQKKNFETLEAPQNRSFYSKIKCLPFGPPIYFEQSICIKRVELLGTHQKIGEPFENLMKTHCEQF
jgi:hypothetical protein